MSEKIARLFHDTYERLAPEFGYETREDTKVFDPESKNGKLMIAVCAEIEKLIQKENLDLHTEKMEVGICLNCQIEINVNYEYCEKCHINKLWNRAVNAEAKLQQANEVIKALKIRKGMGCDHLDAPYRRLLKENQELIHRLVDAENLIIKEEKYQSFDY